MEAAVLRGLRLTALGAWTLLLPGALLTVIRQEINHPSGVIVGLSLVLLHWFAVLVVLLRGWLTRDVLVATAIPLFTGIALIIPVRQTIYPENFWAPGYWSLPWATMAIIILPRRHYLRLLIGIFATLPVIDVVVQYLVGAPVDRFSLQPVPGIVVPIAILLLFCDGLLDLARRSDAATSTRQAAEQEHDTITAQTEGKREAARLLHDHVLHALHALSRDGNLPPQMAAEECRSAVEALSVHLHHDDDQAVDLAEMVRADPALAAAGATLLGEAPKLPHHVARALADATHEALGNVTSHAHASDCTVELNHDSQQWTCTILDNGRGFDPDQIPRGRLGVRRSIGDRLREVGGRATITSRPGRGTTVELVWPAPEEPARLDSGDAQARARQVLTRMAWPNLAQVPILTIMLLPLANPRWPALLATIAVLVTGVLSIRRLHRRPLTERDAGVLLFVAIGSWAVQLLCAPDDTDTVHYLWLAWGCTSLLQLVVLQVRLRTAVAAMAGWFAAMVLLLVARFGWQLPWENLHPVISVGLGEATVGLIAYHSAQRIAERDATQRHIELTMRRESNRLSARHHLDQYWSRRVTGDALPLLRDVAEGRRHSSEPELRRQAELIEATLRDELVLGPNAHHLLTALAARREEGWLLVSTLNQGNDRTQVEAAALMLDHIGPPRHLMQRMTVSAAPDQISVVVLSPSRKQYERWQSSFSQVETDEEFARIVLPLGRGFGPRRAAPEPPQEGPAQLQL
ncbi:sensor histidine kinase [Luteococcus sp. OSA5]|uniref:sensor histidine kinase n=1 Tax=Luteococcus sp. OSA5 TaxID=3401630 RepID=UPI003B43966F